MIDVLVIDRDPQTRQLIGEILGSVSGFRLQCSCGSLEQLDKALSERPVQLILGELKFQDGSIQDRIWILRSRHIPIDWIVVTAETAYHLFRRAQQLGAIDYILKPFSESRLEEALYRYRSMKQSLTPDTPVSQEALDDVFFAGYRLHLLQESPAFYKVSHSVIDTVLQYAKAQGNSGFMVSDLVQAEIVSLSTARRCLKRLEDADLLEAVPEYGQLGRPRNRYRYKASREENT